MRKIISLLLCVLILILSLPAMAAPDNQFAYADGSMRFQILQKLGVLNEDFADLSPDGLITRAEFAGMAARAFDAGFDASPAVYPFEDVSKNTKFSSEIVNLYNMGIISGASNQYFYPDNSIVVNEALSILIKLLGYKPMADSKGGYPYGYQRTADAIDITGNIENYESALTVVEAAEFLYGAMSADKMEGSYGSKEEYTVTKDSNVFWTKYSLSYGSGIVTATEITSLTRKEGCTGGSILIDGVSYKDPEGLGKGLLGYEVDFLYTDNSGQKTIYSVCAGDSNSTVRLNSEDIMLRDNRLYDGAESNNRYTMDSNIYVIYNGIFYGVDFGYDWLPEYGYVTLIDNDGDNTYEVALVKDFKNYVVKSVDCENDIVYDIDYNSIKLKNDDSDICLYYKNGILTEPDEIKENDVLSVCISKDADYAEVYISSSVVEGTVEMMDMDENTVLINDAWYRISPGYSEKILTGYRQPVDVSSEGEFLLDIKGGIAHFIPGKANGLLYGYIIALSNPGSAFDTPAVRLFNEYGEFVDADIPDEVKVNDYKKHTADEVIDLIKAGGSEGKAKNQLVKYRVNSKNELKEISFAQENIDTSNPNLLKSSYGKASRVWRPSSRSFNGALGVSADTLVMVVPENTDELMDERAYKASTLTFFANDATYVSEAYDCSDADVAKAMVVYSDSRSVTDESAVCIFVEAIRALNAEGDEVYKLCYWQRGEYKETEAEDMSVLTDAAFADASTAPKGLECGDAFRYATNSNGKITLVYKILDVSLEKPAQGANPSNANFNQAFRTIYGRLAGLDGTNILLESVDGSWRENHSVHDPSKQTKIMYCDLTAPKPKKGMKSADASMLSRCVGSDEYRILLRTRYCYAYDLIIYKIK